MGRTYARIRVDLAHDPDWLALTERAQLMYLSILFSPRLDVVGCLIIHRSTVYGLAVDSDDRDVDEALKELDHAGMLAVDTDTGELVVRTFVTHDGVLRNQNLARGMWSAWSAIRSERLRKVVVDNLPTEAWDPRFNPPDEARQTRG